MQQLVNRLLHKTAAKTGISIRRWKSVPSWDYTFQTLERFGLRPKTVFDIGVAEGTPWLYRRYPEAKFHLVDPTRESLAYMSRVKRRYNAEIHNVALGNKEAEVNMNVNVDDIGKSSMFMQEGDRSASSYSVRV